MHETPSATRVVVGVVRGHPAPVDTSLSRSLAPGESVGVALTDNDHRVATAAAVAAAATVVAAVAVAFAFASFARIGYSLPLVVFRVVPCVVVAIHRLVSRRRHLRCCRWDAKEEWGSPGERVCGVWWGKSAERWIRRGERREGWLRSTSTARSGSSRESSLVTSICRIVCGWTVVLTRITFPASSAQTDAYCRVVPRRVFVLLFYARSEEAYCVREKVPLVIESQPHAWLRSGVILLFRYCHGYKGGGKWNENPKLIHRWAEECGKKSGAFVQYNPTVWARIDRAKVLRCWRPMRISISVLNISHRYLLRLVSRCPFFLFLSCFPTS